MVIKIHSFQCLKDENNIIFVDKYRFGVKDNSYKEKVEHLIQVKNFKINTVLKGNVEFSLGDNIQTYKHYKGTIKEIKLCSSGNIQLIYTAHCQYHKQECEYSVLLQNAAKLVNLEQEMIKKKVAVKKPALKQVVVKEEQLGQDKEIQTIQDKILKTYPKFRITILKNRKENLEEFIFRFFNEWNHEKDSIMIDTRQVQTTKSRRRSLGDMFILCRYYYPKCTLTEVAKIIYLNMFKKKFENGYVMRTSYCGGTSRQMFYIGSSTHESGNADEFGHGIQWWREKVK